MARTAVTNRFKPRDFGTALSFDGSGDYVEVTDDATLDLEFPFTISFWAKGAQSGNEVIIAKGSSQAYASTNYIVKTTASRIEFGVGAGATYKRYWVDGQHVSREWKHYAIVFTSISNMALYVNGVAYSNTSNDGTATVLATNSSNLRIGSAMGGTPESYSGLIDEPRIWNRALTADEISALYYQGTVPTTGLVAEYLFNEGAGTTATDSSGNGNDGTITGATYTSDVPSYTRTAV